LLAACARQQITYVKPGASQAELQMVVAKCKMSLAQTPMPYQPAEGGLVGLGAAMDNYDAQKDYFSNCMIANGWMPQAQGSNGSQFVEQVKEAVKTCQGADDKDQAVEWAQCWGRVQRPIWVKYKPQYLDLFDGQSADLVKISTQFHKGNITHDEYVSALKESGANWKAKIEDRHNENISE
jgi:hypothetical protein